MATGQTAQNSNVELSTYMRGNLPALLGMDLSPANAQSVVNAIVQQVGKVRPGGPGVILSRDHYETFVSVPLDAGSKVSCVVYFEIKPDGRRVIKRIKRGANK